MERIARGTPCMLLLFLALVAPARAGLLLPPSTVGGADTLLATSADLPNASPTSELAWISSVLGSQATFLSRIDNASASPVDGLAGVLALDLKSTPDYFVVKNARGWSLYQNVEGLQWGVILAQPSLRLRDGGGTISHVSLFSAGVPVPAPATLALASLGMFGILLLRRRRVVG